MENRETNTEKNTVGVNSDQLKGKWTEAKGEIKKFWGRLTDDDVKEFEGNWDGLKGRVQQVYGYSKEKTDTEFDTFKKKAARFFNDKVERVNDKIDEMKTKH